MIKKFIGWRGSGKTTAIINEALRNARRRPADNDERILIIVPDLSSIQYIKSKVKELNNGEIPEKFYIKTLNQAIFDCGKYDTVYIDELTSCIYKLHLGKIKAISDTNEEVGDAE